MLYRSCRFRIYRDGAGFLSFRIRLTMLQPRHRSEGRAWTQERSWWGRSVGVVINTIWRR